MKKLLGKVRAQVGEYLGPNEETKSREAKKGEGEGAGAGDEITVDENGLPSRLTTYPPGTVPYWRPGLYDGENDAAHFFGRCPNFDPAHLQRQRPTIPQPGQRAPGPGRLPPRVRTVRRHDRMHFYHGATGRRHATQRDLGFSGVLDGRIVWTFADTLMGVEEACMICATDSAAIGTKDAPMVLADTNLQEGANSAFVREFVDCSPGEEAAGGLSVHAFGITNIVEVAPNRGIVFFLKNHRPGGVNHIMGAGVATCWMDDSGDLPNVPRARRPSDSETMWGVNEPYWGDVGACLDSRSGLLYVWGHGPAFDGEVAARTYLARVPSAKALDVGAYEYWRGDLRSWDQRRLGDGTAGTVRATPEMAAFGWYHMNQGAPFWSHHFNCWMWVHGSAFPQSDVLVMTADALEGPWREHGAVISTKPEGHRDGFRYCITGHPVYDDSGRTLLVTWTINNSIWGATIEWE